MRLGDMSTESPFLRDAAHRPREPGIVVLERILIEECGEPIADVRERCPGVLVNAPLPWLRGTVCRMVSEAVARMPSGVRMLVTTGMRTLEMQAAGYEAYVSHLRGEHPDWPKPILHRQANRFFHPPHSKCPPGHTTGGAVDVRLVDDEGRELDMWSALLQSSNSTWPTFSRRVSPEVREMRKILYDAMIGVGFSNCWDEWWHYSYGDSGWAARLARPLAVYGRYPEVCYPPEFVARVDELRAAGQLTRLKPTMK